MAESQINDSSTVAYLLTYNTFSAVRWRAYKEEATQLGTALSHYNDRPAHRNKLISQSVL